MGNARTRRRDRRELRALADECSLPQARARISVVSRLGAGAARRAARGLRLIREGLRASRPGSACGRGQARRWATPSKRLRSPANGRGPSGARRSDAVREAIGEREYLPQLLLLDARIADALGEPASGRRTAPGAGRSARAGSPMARDDRVVGGVRKRTCQRRGLRPPSYGVKRTHRRCGNAPRRNSARVA